MAMETARAGLIIGAAPVGPAAAGMAAAQARHALVLCADGGSHSAKTLGIQPDIIIGDGDSGAFQDAALMPGAEYKRLPVEKDDTDTLACARIALERGVRELLLVGCTGGRLDHFMANVGVLEFLYDAGCRASIADEQNIMRIHADGVYEELPPAAYPFFSVIALDARVEGVTLQGLRYPLTAYTLTRSFPIGVSNAPLSGGKPVRVSVKSGRVLLVYSRDKE